MADEKAAVNVGEAAVKPKKKVHGCFVFLAGVLILFAVAFLIGIAYLFLVYATPKGAVKRYVKAINGCDIVGFYDNTIAGETQLTLALSDTKDVERYLENRREYFTDGKRVSKVEKEKIDDFEDSAEYKFLMSSYKSAGVDIEIKDMAEATVTFDSGDEQELILYRYKNTWYVADTTLMPYVEEYSEYSYQINYPGTQKRRS
jgi:hypothetical protein